MRARSNHSCCNVVELLFFVFHNARTQMLRRSYEVIVSLIPKKRKKKPFPKINGKVSRPATIRHSFSALRLNKIHTTMITATWMFMHYNKGLTGDLLYSASHAMAKTFSGSKNSHSVGLFGTGRHGCSFTNSVGLINQSERLVTWWIRWLRCLAD